MATIHVYPGWDRVLDDDATAKQQRPAMRRSRAFRETVRIEAAALTREKPSIESSVDERPSIEDALTAA